MSLRSEAAALIVRFVSDIDTIIREHAERATLIALVKRGLAPPKQSKRPRSPAPLETTTARPSKAAAKPRQRPAKATKAGRAKAERAKAGRAKAERSKAERTSAERSKARRSKAGRTKAQRTKAERAKGRAGSNRKNRKRRVKTPAEQLSLF